MSLRGISVSIIIAHWTRPTVGIVLTLCFYKTLALYIFQNGFEYLLVVLMLGRVGWTKVLLGSIRK